MTKNSKKKKQKKADFTKVKMKVGKKLKKAQNETRTEFKARKIILQEQLGDKAQGLQMVTKKQQSVKELLSRINHQNPYARQDALNGMKELIESNCTDKLLPHMHTFMVGISPCIWDADAEVRSQMTALVETLLLKVKDKMEPFFHLLVSHLVLSMVHLRSVVQVDSLKLMNILITHAPSLLARHATTLLPKFVDVISRKSVSVSSTPEAKQLFCPTLAMDPSSQVSAFSWRRQLLKELSRFLEAVLRETRLIETVFPQLPWVTIMEGSLAPVAAGSSGRGSQQTLEIFANPAKLSTFMVAITDLLFQTWAEVKPTTDVANYGGSALNHHAFETLTSIMDIISCLLSMAKLCRQDLDTEDGDFMGDYLLLLDGKFEKSIMPGFPFSMHEVLERKKKRKKAVTSEAGETGAEVQSRKPSRSAEALNVMIVSLAVQLRATSRKYRSVFILYLTGLLADADNDGQYNMLQVISGFTVLMSPKHWQVNAAGRKRHAAVGDALSSAFTCYQRLHFLKKDRRDLLQLVMKATDFEHRYLWSCVQVRNWIKFLMEEVTLKEVHKETLDVVLALKLRNTSGVRDLLRCNKVAITDNLTQRNQHISAEDKNRVIMLLFSGL